MFLLPDCSIYVKVGSCGTALLTHVSPVSTGRADTYPVWLHKHDPVLSYQSAFLMICPRQCEDFPAVVCLTASCEAPPGKLCTLAFHHFTHTHVTSQHLPSSPGSFTDPSAEGLSRERARERDRSRPHERRHHSSAGEKQRYYSCERYGSREQCHTKSAGPSRSTSPGESHDVALLKQVRRPTSVIHRQRVIHCLSLHMSDLIDNTHHHVKNVKKKKRKSFLGLSCLKDRSRESQLTTG